MRPFLWHLSRNHNHTPHTSVFYVLLFSNNNELIHQNKWYISLLKSFHRIPDFSSASDADLKSPTHTTNLKIWYFLFLFPPYSASRYPAVIPFSSAWNFCFYHHHHHYHHSLQNKKRGRFIGNLTEIIYLNWVSSFDLTWLSIAIFLLICLISCWTLPPFFFFRIKTCQSYNPRR